MPTLTCPAPDLTLAAAALLADLEETSPRVDGEANWLAEAAAIAKHLQPGDASVGRTALRLCLQGAARELAECQHVWASATALAHALGAYLETEFDAGRGQLP